MFIFYTCITNRMANAPEATLESTSTSEPARSFQDNRQESSFKGFWPLFNKPDRADFKCTSGAIHATSKPLYSCKHAPILTKQNVCQQVHVQSHVHLVFSTSHCQGTNCTATQVQGFKYNKDGFCTCRSSNT